MDTIITIINQIIYTF